MTKEQITAEITAARERLQKLEEELKKEDAKLPPFFDVKKHGLTFSEYKDGDWIESKPVCRALPQDVNIQARLLGEYAGKGFYLHGDWTILTDSEGAKVLTLQRYVDEIAPKTFEKFGRTWKRHDGSRTPPQDAIGARVCRYITKKEMSGDYSYNDTATHIFPDSNWTEIVAYCPVN
jgi:hypothetical protein